MSCGCAKVEKTNLWTPVPPYRQPTEIQPGENIDCYMKRAGNTDNKMEDLGPPPPDKIANTSIVSTIDRSTTQKETKVNETFVLTPESTRSATNWEISVNGSAGLGPLAPELTFNSSSGVLSGEILDEEKKAKNYKVKITANDGAGMIDSREYNLYIRDEKEDEIKFLIPLVGPGARVTSKFGPRSPPASGASSVHRGIDMSCTGDARGDIIASADGVVVQAGPARGFGNWIIIDHFDKNGKKVAATLYAHMNTMYVSVGQRVSAGQVIAKEGTAGIGSGAHLHFEIHRGGYKNPVDPMPYFEGTADVAVDNSGGSAPPDSVPSTTVTNSGTGMVADQAAVNEDCTPSPSNINTAVEAPPDQPLELPLDNTAPNVSDLKPPVSPSPEAVAAEINRALDDAGITDIVDRDLIMSTAVLESNLDPFAKAVDSSALGLFQFKDRLAAKYLGDLGYAPTEANRCDPYIATRAMSEFFKEELEGYWNSFLESGKSSINGSPIRASSFSDFLGTGGPPYFDGLRKSEFIYGLIHHDGIGAATKGIDNGGLLLWRKLRGTA